MNNIRPLYRTAQSVLVGFGYRHAVLFDVIIKDPEAAFRHDNVALKPFFVLVGTDNGYIVTLAFQRAYQVHCRNGRAVVFSSENVADDCYLHVRTPIGKSYFYNRSIR